MSDLACQTILGVGGLLLGAVLVLLVEKLRNMRYQKRMRKLKEVYPTLFQRIMDEKEGGKHNES